MSTFEAIQLMIAFATL
ncbi:putative holin-like toxin, partial [Enterococcus hirae]